MPRRKRIFSWKWIGKLGKLGKFFDRVAVWVDVVIGAALVLGLVGLIVLVRFVVFAWLGGQVSAPVPASAVSSSSAAGSSALAAASSSSSSVPVLLLAQKTTSITTEDGFNGSFTELFSGTGWDDVQKTTAYLDPTATAISLTPKFMVTPVATETGGTGGQIPTVPANITGTVTKTSDGYEIGALGHTATSSYQGVLRFGYDPATGNTLVVYAAYEGIVFQVDAHGAVTDYSDRFGQRAFGGAKNGELAVQPVIFPEDGGWWIASGDGSTKPFLERISGSSVIDYASLAFPGISTLRAAPGTQPHTVLVTADGKTYLLRDEGFSPDSVQWTSLRLNGWSGVISKAIISRVEDATVRSSTPHSGGVAYFLSNDGGDTWIPAVPGAPVTFPASGGSTSLAAGGDFRFKIELSPDVGDQYATPWVGLVEMEYLIARK